MLYGIYTNLGVIGNVFGIFYEIIFFLPFIADRLITLKIKGFFFHFSVPSGMDNNRIPSFFLGFYR